jgi:uncharacterized RDD family membrane protein YckC
MAMRDKYRTFWPRFWAGLVDALVLAPVGVMDLWFWHQDASTAARVVWWTFGHAAGLLYSILLHGLWGQTLGKLVMGIRVLDVSGSPLKMWQAVLRDSLGIAFATWVILSRLPLVLSGLDPRLAATDQMGWLQLASAALLLLELATMQTNAKRRALHDLLAGSVVIRLRKRWTVGHGDTNIPSTSSSLVGL